MTSDNKPQIPDDPRAECPFCKGVGKRKRTQFASAMDMDANDTPTTYMASCHECHGNGWIWALTQSEMAECISQQAAELAQAQQTLREWLAANGSGGWIDDLRKQVEKDRATIARLSVPQIRKELLHQYANATEGLSANGPQVAALIEIIDKQDKELAALKAENARLKAPVSDEEWATYCFPTASQIKVIARQDFDFIIQSRLSAPPPNTNPPGPPEPPRPPRDRSVR